MGGCGNSGCTCADCGCAPGQCTCKCTPNLPLSRNVLAQPVAVVTNLVDCRNVLATRSLSPCLNLRIFTPVFYYPRTRRYINGVEL